MAITIDTSQASTVDPSSSVAGSVVTLVPRLSSTEGGYDNLFNAVRTTLSGVLNQQPSNVITRLASASNTWGAGEHGWYSYNGLVWFPLGNAPVFPGNNTVVLQHNTPFIADTVYIGRDRFERTSQITSWIATIAAAYPSLVRLLPGCGGYLVDVYTPQTDELGRTQATGSLLYGFFISTGGAPKRIIAMQAGVHAGEEFGITHLRATVGYLLGGSIEATTLLNAFDFVILPRVNAPGGDTGCIRGCFETLAGHNDLNRHFEDITNVFETVLRPRRLLDALLTSGQTAGFIDFHTTRQDCIRGYYSGLGSALDASWIAKFQARAGGAGNYVDVGSNPGGTAIGWAINKKGAQIGQVVECNTTFHDMSDATVAAYGPTPIQTLYDMYQAGDFGPMAGTPPAAKDNYVLVPGGQVAVNLVAPG